MSFRTLLFHLWIFFFILHVLQVCNNIVKTFQTELIKVQGHPKPQVKFVLTVASQEIE